MQELQGANTQLPQSLPSDLIRGLALVLVLVLDTGIDPRVTASGTSTPCPIPALSSASCPAPISPLTGPCPCQPRSARLLPQPPAYAGEALSGATRQAYARNWQFADWRRAKDADPAALPVHPLLVAAYLADLASRIGWSGLDARLAAIIHHYHGQNQPWSSKHPAIRATLRGIMRQHGKPVRPAAVLTSAEVRRLLEACGNDLAGIRDRALFLTCLAGALRRSDPSGQARGGRSCWSVRRWPPRLRPGWNSRAGAR
jgi:hypothetical protein